MDLTTGSLLGPYEIVSRIGSGGMGEVFKARDTRLNRSVAIKILPEEFKNKPELRARLEREAKVISQLNHPHICTLHDVGHQHGTSYLVMELLEGETLADRIARSALPISDVLRYGAQIAEALDVAHRAGIVHRDLKPGNIMITKSGAKLLDFGLAHSAFSPATNDSATVERPITAEGIAVGTLPYMAPEQLQGTAVDSRTDIFAFGCVLYEAITGRRAFTAASSASLIAEILEHQPPKLTDLQPGIPRALEHIVMTCLEKDPDARFQSAADIAHELRWIANADSIAAPAALTTKPRRLFIWTTAVLLVALTIVSGVLIRRLGRDLPRDTPQVQRVHRLTDFPGIKEFPSISPDGRSVAFTASVDRRRQIFIRLLSGGMPVQITKDAIDHQLPRWSPDGNSLVYFSPGGRNEAEGAIWSIPALGGSPRRVIDSIGSADISRDGRLTCFRLINGHVQLVTSSLEGTDMKVIARPVPGYHLYPRWSPDGQWIAFQRGDGVRYDIFVIQRTGGEPRQITHDRNMIRGLAWLPDGKGIVYGSSRENTLPYLPALALWQVPLQGGAPRQITPADVWYEQPDVHSGTALVSATRVRMRFDIWSFPFDGDAAENVRRAARLTRQTGQVLTPSASPDGDHIAFLSDSGGHGNLWVMSTRSGGVRQITFEDDPAVTVGVPVWSPDGSSIAFVSSKGRTGLDFGVWLVDADGRNLRNVAKRGLGAAWSPDSQWLYYAETAAGVLDKVGAAGGTPVRVRNEPTRNVIGVHGTTLYYTVARVLLDGRPEFEIRAATPESGPSRALARIAASRVPSWQIVNPALSPDGEWLAMPLTDDFTTNIWALSTRNGTWRQVTDFGDRATFIARRVSWSSDGQAIFAAVGEGDADIVLLEGLIARR
jgi:serine/threonine protein kinase